MAQTALDVTKVMILLQRRYNFMREIRRLTGELEEALARNDEVSTSMVLQMRADEMAKADNCIHELWKLGGDDKKAQRRLCLLMMSEPDETASEDPEERKIYEIRRKTQTLIDELREIDRRLSRKLAGDKSYYGVEGR